ncbi:MAG: hypothetical protein R3F35_04620 [Myxococcota bacterium]
MPVIHTPKLNEVAQQLEPLMGRATKVTAASGPNKLEASCQTARYVTRDDKLAALCQVDVGLAAALGAALALLPAGAAEDAAKAGKLPDNLLDAFSEVANILAGVLCVDGALHVRWTTVAQSQAELSADDKALLAKPASRLDVTVEIEGFGAGKLSIVTAKR